MSDDGDDWKFRDELKERMAAGRLARAQPKAWSTLKETVIRRQLTAAVMALQELGITAREEPQNGKAAVLFAGKNDERHLTFTKDGDKVRVSSSEGLEDVFENHEVTKENVQAKIRDFIDALSAIY